MADLQEELQRFLTARFGVDVKDAFVSCIQKIHKENQNVAALEQPMKDATQQVLDIREEVVTASQSAVQTADDVQQGGLAGAAGAQNGHEFVVPQVQTDVVQCVLHQLAGLIFFVDLFELEHKCAFPVLRRRALLPVV